MRVPASSQQQALHGRARFKPAAGATCVYPLQASSRHILSILEQPLTRASKHDAPKFALIGASLTTTLGAGLVVFGGD
jgi:hypothetical protein